MVYKNKTLKIFLTCLLVLSVCLLNGCDIFYDMLDTFDDYNYTDVSGEFAVHFIDVGQGDSILIQNPDNDFMLIDTGEGNQYNKLTGYFENFNVSKFKYVVFTHPHADHIGSADKIVKNYDIETLIMPDAVNKNSQVFERLVTEIENKNLEITLPEFGAGFEFGGAEFIILAPVSEEYKNLNNYSVVILMIYGNTRFIFTGDAEKESENEIIEYCGKNNINISADILKAGHHGSSTSSQQKFLNLIQPSLAVITCGKDNSYNHPNMQVVERFESMGAEVLRTDIDGDIVIISDGRNLSVKKGRGDFEEVNTW